MQRPDVLDSRSILTGYFVLACIAGLVVVGYRWPAPPTLTPQQISMTSLWSLLLVSMGNAVWISGLVALGLARIENDTMRLSALRIFAFVLIAVGGVYFAPAFPIVRSLLPPGVAGPPIVAGFILLILSFDPVSRRGPTITSPDGFSVTFHDRPTLALRGHYEEQIRRAARQEERARLARDLHDAVKQQLFAIQTAAATAETRFDSDASGARTALAQVRTSAREALTEMEVMLEQLQATPLTTAGLVESLKRACEASRFRTGAEIDFETGDLPPDTALQPGAHQAMLRFAQEALANVARHARAQRVHVRFGLDREWTPPGSDRRRFLLSISDDGQGFDIAAPAAGMGLRSMAARAAEAGGVMELTSKRGSGTTVSLSIVNEVAPRRRYITYAVVAGVAIPVILALDLLQPEDRVSHVFWVIAAGVAVARFGIAAYRVRSWR